MNRIKHTKAKQNPIVTKLRIKLFTNSPKCGTNKATPFLVYKALLKTLYQGTGYEKLFTIANK